MKWNARVIVEELKEIVSYDNNISIDLEYLWNPAENLCSKITVLIEDLEDPINKGLIVTGFTDGRTLSDTHRPKQKIPLVEIRNFIGVGIDKNADKRLKDLHKKLVSYFSSKSDIRIVEDLTQYISQYD